LEESFPQEQWLAHIAQAGLTKHTKRSNISFVFIHLAWHRKIRSGT
jgi:hypothetical protein